MADDLATLIKGVEDLKKSLDAKVEKITLANTDYRTDLDDLKTRVDEATKASANLNDDNLLKLLNDVMSKQKLEQAHDKVLWPHQVNEKIGLPDPDDPAFDPALMGEMDHGTLLSMDVETIKGTLDSSTPVSARGIRAGMERIIELPIEGDNHRALCRMAMKVKIVDALAQMIWQQRHGTDATQPYPGMASLFPEWGKAWKFYQMRYINTYVTKADGDLMDTVDTTNWVPTGFSAEVRELIKLELRVSAAFESFTVVKFPFKPNIDVSDFLGNFMPETTTLSGADPFSTAEQSLLQKVDTGSPPTFNGRKIRVRMIRAGELDEDTVIPLVNLIQRRMVRSHAETEEHTIINGQRTSDIDTGDTIGTNDNRKAFDGIRFFIEQLTNATVDASQTLTSAMLVTTIREKMGEYGIEVTDLIHIPSTVAYLKMIGLSEVLTVEKFGPEATIHRGQLAAVGGVPVIPSRHVRIDLNAVGVFDDVTKDRTEILTVNLRAWAVARGRQVTLELTRWAATDVNDLVSFARYDLQNWWGTGFNTAAAIINI